MSYCLGLHFDYSVVRICMIHCRCSLLNFGCYCNSNCTFDIYAYKLLTWTRAHHMCKKCREHPTLESQEPHKTTLCPEEYMKVKNTSHSLLVVNNTDHCPQDIETETYLPCGNSQQSSYRVCIALAYTVGNIVLHVCIISCGVIVKHLLFKAFNY